MKGAAVAVALVVGAQVGEARAQTPVEAYSAAPTFELIDLSPSGDLVARINVIGDQRAVIVTNLSTGENLAAAPVGDLKVRDLQWIGEDRVLIVTSQTRSIPEYGMENTEVFFGLILNVRDGSMLQALANTDNVLGALFDTIDVRRTDRGDELLVRGLSLAGDRQFDLFRIDFTNGKGRVASRLTYEDQNAVVDPDGEVIATERYDDIRRRWSLMLPIGRNDLLRASWTLEAPVDTPTLVGLGRGPRTVIVIARRPDLTPDADYRVAFEVNVDTEEWTRLPVDSDPDGFVYHPATHLLIGSSRIDEDGIHYEFFDEAAKQRWTAIERAFAGKRPRLVSWSADLHQVVVFTDIGESGTYHLVDFDKGQANILGKAYPSIADAQVGATRAIRYTAADGLVIHGYLTLPPGVEAPSGLPLVVLAHGGPASRDVIGFDWWVQALASRGYAVLQANFRGSTDYGREFLEAGYGEWGRKMQTDLSDGVRWLAERGAIDPARVCIVGASYGGYAAMAGLTIDHGVYRCAVSVGGVSDLRRLVNREAREGNKHDNQTVRYWTRYMGAERLNDRGLDDLSPAYHAAEADGPLLLIHGQDDTVVNIEQSRVMAEAMNRAGKSVRLVELTGEDHWQSRVAGRQRMLTETIQFLEANNPPR
jgi:dipeptidyl aminopeptidase/acylaminoacyl peptidase